MSTVTYSDNYRGEGYRNWWLQVTFNKNKEDCALNIYRQYLDVLSTRQYRLHKQQNSILNFKTWFLINKAYVSLSML